MTLTTITTDFLFTGEAPPILNGTITFDENGTIHRTGVAANAPYDAVHYPGAVCPGFVNAHIHTELSHLATIQEAGPGMAQFIKSLSMKRHQITEQEREVAIAEALMTLYHEGTSGAGDICNEPVSFAPKKNGEIRWHHFIEVFGTQSATAKKNHLLAKQLRQQSINAGFPASLTPHATYSLSHDLYALIRQHLSETGDCLSVHFMESLEELDLLHHRSGRLAELFEGWGLSTDYLPATIQSALDQVVATLPNSNRTMFVHNTFIDDATIRGLIRHFTDPWFCVCPTSNLNITQTLPPVPALRTHSTQLLIGTDSRASNPKLSMVEEIKLLQKSFPGIPLHEIIGWGTTNGARFFGWDDLGSIEPGKTPGLVWLQNFYHPHEIMSAQVIGQRII